MGMRELAEDIKRQQYFEAVPTPEPEQDEGTRELGVLYPFLISGGSNTERYYLPTSMTRQSTGSISDRDTLVTNRAIQRHFRKEFRRY